MKKLIVISAIAIAIAIGATAFITASQDRVPNAEKSGVVFLTESNYDAEEFVLSKKSAINNILSFGEGLSGEIIYGKPIYVRNAEGVYFVPVFNNRNCVHILYIFMVDGEFNLQSSNAFADVINSLSPGKYYFEKDKEDYAIWLIGNNTRIPVDGDFLHDYKNLSDGNEVVNVLDNEIELDLFDSLSYDLIDSSNAINRSIVGNIIPMST